MTVVGERSRTRGLGGKRKGKMREMRLGVEGVILAPGPSGCTVTATFRDFAASKNVSKEKQSNAKLTATAEYF